MNLFYVTIINIVETVLRFCPFPCKKGLFKIGSPNRNSPVLLTGNFHLTVVRLKRALKGMNCYLLVANSNGINVWCAATGGLLNNHDVISVLKISGIESVVDHRNVILPQLAATGIDVRTIRQKTGWNVIWGPVYADDIPAFTENNLKKTKPMKNVLFPCTQRLEMAVAWAFPFSIVSSLILLLLWQKMILPVALFIWGLSLFIFLTFPIYSRLLNTEGKKLGLVKFDFERGGFQLLLWIIVMTGIIIYSVLFGNLSWSLLLPWGIISLIAILILSLDLTGSTPIFKSGLHEDRLLTITLNNNKCKIAGFCEDVCPRNCYDLYKEKKKLVLARGDQCVQCGACIVQCPYDALYFKSPDGDTTPPETIRKFKLNLMGKRLIKAGHQ